MRWHSLVELTEHDESTADIILHSMWSYTYMHCCIHSTCCVPIMNGRRRGSREESRKQALDSAWSIEMSKLVQDETAEPVSRDQVLRRERGQRIIHFSCSAADHEQNWQPCPFVRAIHTNIVLHAHTAVVTHIYMHIIQQQQ